MLQCHGISKENRLEYDRLHVERSEYCITVVHVFIAALLKSLGGVMVHVHCKTV